MIQADPDERVVVDWLTTVAIAACAIALTQIIHEGVHALSCVGVGGKLQEFSAIHVSCRSDTVWQSKTVSGSAALVNLGAGLALLALLRRIREGAPAFRFFTWLFMLMNWLLGAGYLMFSGVGKVGDLANVIAGLEPEWLWRLLMTIVGTVLYLFLVWLALRELGRFIGGTDRREQIRRATRLGALSYVTVLCVTLAAGLFNPLGITGLPAVAAMLLALGGMFPLLWMMQWFRSAKFVKRPHPPLAIHRSWFWIAGGGGLVILYAVVLGRTLYF